MSSNRRAFRLPHRSLFGKYLMVLFAAVALPLVANGAVEGWLGFRDKRSLMNERLAVEAANAAGKIETFLDRIHAQLGWMVHLRWTDETGENHRLDALRLLRQVPAIVEVALLDDAGLERLSISRIARDVIGPGQDRSQDPAFLGARKEQVWFGPVSFNRGSEPHMVMAISGKGRTAGVVLAKINLKLIGDVISEIRIGQSGAAYVVDGANRLIAHPDIDRVLKGRDADTAGHVGRLQAKLRANGTDPVPTTDLNGDAVIAAMTRVPGVNWRVVVEQPLAEAYAPIRAAAWRTLLLVLAGAALALALALMLARQLVRPIRILERGAQEIRAGNFAHRLDIRSGDEFGRLADRFNDMAQELAVSQERSVRIGRLKQFLSPQVAEIIDSSNGAGLLEPRRSQVAIVFCDLRGFTAFSGEAEPEEVMRVLSEYYSAVGTCISNHEATLTHFAGDGVMALINAPMPCPGPAAVEAVRLAVDMQAAVRDRIAVWRRRGHAIGCGIGVATGPATVGRVGYKDRHDYTAIGPVVNLAARLSADAEDGEVLVDAACASEASGAAALTPAGTRILKGFGDPVPVFTAVATQDGSAAA